MTLFVLLCAITVNAQNITVTGDNYAEIGITKAYTIKFRPAQSIAFNAYRINFWNIYAEVNGSTIVGEISSPPFGSTSGTGLTLNSGLTDIKSTSVNTERTVYIKWGDNAPDVDNFRVILNVDYGNGPTFSDYVTNGTFINYVYNKPNNNNPPIEDGTDGYYVDLKKINPPTISSPNILSCCSANATITASNFGDGNSFTWNITGGANYSGTTTSPQVIITPTSDNTPINITCTVKRTTASTSYSKTSTITLNKTARSLTLETSPIKNYLCKNTGLIFQVENSCGINNVAWNAPNCSVSSEIIVGTKRQVTITPNSSIPTGSILNISAVANYTGGCSAISPTKSFSVYENGTPPTPFGSIHMEPMGYDINPDITFCESIRAVPVFDENLDIFGEIIDPSHNYFINGNTTITPVMVNVRQIKYGTSYTQTPITFTICNTNPCNGEIKCKQFQVNQPICFYGGPGEILFEKQNINSTKDNDIKKFEIALYPNPTSENFNIELTQNKSGKIIVNDIFGNIIKQSDFSNTKKISLSLNNFKKGIYFVKTIIDEEVYVNKVILE